MYPCLDYTSNYVSLIHISCSTLIMAQQPQQTNGNRATDLSLDDSKRQGTR